MKKETVVDEKFEQSMFIDVSQNILYIPSPWCPNRIRGGSPFSWKETNRQVVGIHKLQLNSIVLT